MKLRPMYEQCVQRLSSTTPDAPDFGEVLKRETSLLIKLGYAYHLRETRPDGSTDWSAADYFLTQVEQGMHRHGIVPGWEADQ